AGPDPDQLLTFTRNAAAGLAGEACGLAAMEQARRLRRGFAVPCGRIELRLDRGAASRSLLPGANGAPQCTGRARGPHRAQNVSRMIQFRSTAICRRPAL